MVEHQEDGHFCKDCPMLQERIANMGVSIDSLRKCIHAMDKKIDELVNRAVPMKLFFWVVGGLGAVGLVAGGFLFVSQIMLTTKIEKINTLQEQVFIKWDKYDQQQASDNLRILVVERELAHRTIDDDTIEKLEGSMERLFKLLHGFNGRVKK